MKIEIRQLLEILGVIGVISSLIFVGLEINQNSNIARAEAQHNVTADMIEISSIMASDSELTDTLANIFDNDLAISDLTTSESLRVRFLYLGMLYLWESVYDSVQAGILPESELQQIARGGFFNNDFFRDAWPLYLDSVNSDFAEYFGSLEWNSSP